MLLYFVDINKHNEITFYYKRNGIYVEGTSVNNESLLNYFTTIPSKRIFLLSELEAFVKIANEIKY